MAIQTPGPMVVRRLYHFAFALPMNKLICLCLLMLVAVAGRAQDNIILKTGQEVSAKVLEVSKAEIKYKRADNPDGPIYTMTAGEVFLIKYANGTKDVLAEQPQAPAPQLMPGQPNGGPAYRNMNRRQGRLRPGVDRLGDRGPGMPGGAAPALVGLRYHSGLFSNYFVDGQGTRLGYGEARTMMAGQPDALRALQRGRQLRVAALVTAIPAVALIVTGVALAAYGQRGGRNGGFGRSNDPDDFGPNGIRNDRNDRGDRVVGAALAGGGLLLGITSAVLSHKATIRFRAAARYRAGEGTSLQLTPAKQGLGVGLVMRF
ncbi:hypothetical protein [Fibrella aquatilis]|uniref:Uncharacterized protein n=1 Tax=Fibrella aquatilis TaxID=2817059 RepID=A0A939GA11_9BACT|nr:hypothetical protein [Fibrella aquatilis]MBO0933060.1 hypothetical protein [Fibrella aquatilis]